MLAFASDTKDQSQWIHHPAACRSEPQDKSASQTSALPPHPAPDRAPESRSQSASPAELLGPGLLSVHCVRPPSSLFSPLCCTCSSSTRVDQSQASWACDAHARWNNGNSSDTESSFGSSTHTYRSGEQSNSALLPAFSAVEFSASCRKACGRSLVHTHLPHSIRHRVSNLPSPIQ